MECHVCEVRSSVGFCIECQGLLCELCGVPCEQCGSLTCAKHVHETKSGRSLCINCYEDRKAKKAQLKAAREHHEDEDTSLDGLNREAAAEEEAVVLVASARKPVAPWQWSVYVAAAGAFIVFLMFLFPTLRRVPLSGTSYISTPLFVLMFPVLSIVWGAIGLVRVEYFRDRPKCLGGIGLALVTIVLAVVAIRTDPAAKAEAQAKSFQEVREQMTPEQREDWRKNILDKYK